MISEDLPRIMIMRNAKNVDDEFISSLKQNKIPAVGRLVTYWKEIEQTDGEYNLIDLKTALNKIENADLWCFGYLQNSSMPNWFINKYPDCHIISGSGSYTWQNQKMLSPWFVASGKGDYYIKRHFDALINEYTKHRNVNGVFLNWQLFNMVSRYDNETKPYFKCFDPYAIKSYKETFGNGSIPPKDYDEYLRRGIEFQKEFEKWYKIAAIQAIEKYLQWIGDRIKYKVVFIYRHPADSNFVGVHELLGMTEYQIKQLLNVISKYPNIIQDFESLEDATTEYMIKWAKQYKIIFGGENGHVVGDANWLRKAIDNFVKYKAEMFFYVSDLNLNNTLFTQLKRINQIYPPVLPSQIKK